MVCLKIDFPLISIILATYRKKTRKKTIDKKKKRKKKDENLVSKFLIYSSSMKNCFHW